MDGAARAVLERRWARMGRAGDEGMRRAAKYTGIALVLLGFILVPIGTGILPAGHMAGQVAWTGWGAFALAFGAGFIVWSTSEPKKKKP